MDVGRPLKARGVSVAGPDMAVLERFESLRGAEFVGLVGMAGELSRVVKEWGIGRTIVCVRSDWGEECGDGD